MTDRQGLLQRLETEKRDPVLGRVIACLRLEETRVLVDRPYKVTVSEALRLWTTRMKNMKITGKRLDGVETLVHCLEGMTPQRKLEQVAVVGSSIGANLFFSGSAPHGLVGAIVFDLKARGVDRQDAA